MILFVDVELSKLSCRFLVNGFATLILGSDDSDLRSVVQNNFGFYWEKKSFLSFVRENQSVLSSYTVLRSSVDDF